MQSLLVSWVMYKTFAAVRFLPEIVLQEQLLPEHE